MHPAEFFEGEEQSLIIQEIGKVFTQGETHVTANFRSKDGTLIPHLFSGQRLAFAGGVYLIGMGVDITEQQQAERALRNSEEKFRQLAEHIDDVFWMTDPAKSQMLYVSPAYETLWGHSSARELYADPQKFLEPIHPDDRPHVLAALSQQATGDYDIEYRLARPSGTLRWIHDRAFPITDEAGSVTRVVGVAEDITRRKEDEADLRVLNERLEQLVSERTPRARAGQRATFARRLSRRTDRPPQPGALFRPAFAGNAAAAALPR